MRLRLRLILMVVAGVVTLAGCATPGMAPAGMASYQLERSPGGACKVAITSGREITAGSLKVGPDCTIEASAETLTGAALQTQMMGTIGTLVGRLPPLR